jgi:hypothetical protein
VNVNCLEIQDYLQQFLDGDADPISEHVHAHCESCATCRDLFRAARTLKDGVRLLPIPFPPADFAQRVAARISAEHHVVRRPDRWLTAAACILVGGLWGVGAIVQSLREPNLVKTLAIEQRPDTFREKLREVRSATYDATKQVVEETMIAASSLVPSSVALPRPSLPAPMEATFLPIREVGQTVAIGGMEPVAHTARRAWVTFKREMPVLGEW